MARVINRDSQLSQSVSVRALKRLPDRCANWNDSPTQATSRGTRVAYRYSLEGSACPERLHATCLNIADLQFIANEKNFHAFQKEIDPDRG